MINVGLHWLHTIQAVAPQRRGDLAGGEILPHSPFWMQRVDCHVFHHISETFVQPQVIPPLHGHQITKPLVAEFVSDDGGDEALGRFWR